MAQVVEGYNGKLNMNLLEYSQKTFTQNNAARTNNQRAAG